MKIGSVTVEIGPSQGGPVKSVEVITPTGKVLGRAPVGRVLNPGDMVTVTLPSRT